MPVPASVPAFPLGSAAVPRRVWSATLLSAVGRQWGALCTVLSLAILARALTPADFGRYTFYLAVLGFLDVLVDCGTSSAALQLGAGDARRFAGALAAGRRIRAGAALLGAGCVALVGGLAGEEQLGWVLLAALGPLARVPEMSAVAFQREIAWGRPLLLRAIGASLRLLAILGLSTRPGLGFGPFLVAHAAALALGNLGLARLARPWLPAPAPPLPGFLARALPLAAIGLVQQAYFWADNGFVRAWAGPEELGRYNAAVRLFLWLAFFAAFATTSALPWLARAHGEGKLGQAVGALARPLVLGFAALAGALSAAGAPLLGLLFGAPFEAAAASLAWLSLALVAVALGAVFLTALIAAGRARAALGVATLALVVNLIGNALLVPRLGAEGAAVTTLLTESSVALAAGLALARLGAGPRLGVPALALAPGLFGAAWLAARALFAALSAA